MTIKASKIKKILLYYYEYNLPVNEIALAVKVPEKTIRNLIKKHPVPISLNFRKDNKVRANQDITSLLHENQRQKEKIKELERINDLYKENEHKNSQLLEKTELERNSYRQECAREKLFRTECQAVIQKQKQLIIDMKKQYDDVILKILALCKNAKETWIGERKEFQEKIETLKQTTEQKRKHIEELELKLHKELEKTSTKNHWVLPIVALSIITVVGEIIPILLNPLTKTAIQNPPRKPVMNNNSISWATINSNYPTPARTTIDNQQKHPTSPNPPTKPTADAAQIKTLITKSNPPTQLSTDIDLPSQSPPWYFYPSSLSGANLGIPLKKMSGPQFVEFLAWFLSQQGFPVKILKPTHDMGGDIIFDRYWEKIIIQAKKRKQQQQTIGVDAIQAVYTAKDIYQGTKAMVITTSHFTPEALKMAKKLNVECWDLERLLTELHNHGIYYPTE